MRVLVFGKIKDRSRIYGYDNIDFHKLNVFSLCEIPFQIYNAKGIVKLFLYPIILSFSIVYYSFFFFKTKTNYTYLIVAPESPGLVLLAKILSLIFSKNIPLVYIDYYWSPYLTTLDRKANNYYSKFSIYISKQLEKIIFKLCHKILESVSDEAQFIDKVLFKKKYNHKIIRIPYPCFLKEPKIEVFLKTGTIVRNKIYFWGSGAPLQGVDSILKIINSLSEEGYKCVFASTKSIIETNEIHKNVELHYFEDKNENDIIEFYRQVRRFGILTLGVFGNSIKANHVFPNKIVESLCLGVPVITNNNLFISKMISEFKNDKPEIILTKNEISSIVSQIKKKIENNYNEQLYIKNLNTNCYTKEYFQVVLKNLNK